MSMSRVQLRSGIEAEFCALHERRDPLSEEEVVRFLELEGEELAALYRAADGVRRHHVGDEIFIRGIFEFSNFCRLSCHYCGIRREMQGVKRYRIPPEELIEWAVRAGAQGCGTVVLQSRDDPWYTLPIIARILSEIKERAGLAITLSIGERPYEELLAFRRAGCDRFLLRFETSDRGLFERLHPDDDFGGRIRCIHDIRRAGIQLGSGFMVGLPGAGMVGIARDILFTTSLRLDMIGIGPFIPHPVSSLAEAGLLENREVYFKTLAILRLLNPCAHIPATTAYDIIFPGGRDLALKRGANVFMANLMPQKFRKHYHLYPGKPGVDEDG
ncbi:MAG: [FeFe] hydrogenase H-cluster radical SAM maturase HydE, partial [Planctomycetes bacterium]|nr:[FeFe] hydrogenase H-cluster radical SAM maturase HydE [Planctomycetota bacterium]